MNPRLCYILPKYDPDSEEHFHHIYGFLQFLGQSVDVFLIVERATRKPSVANMRHIRVQRWPFPIRALEMLAWILEARLRGYRIFYVHYSYVGAVCASAVARLLGGRVFYWNCGLASMFFQPWALNRKALATKFTAELPLRLALRMAHHLVTGTRGMADYYARELSVPPHRILVVPNEIDLRHFSTSASRTEARLRLGYAEREVVLFLHRLSPRKGADLLPEIIERVVRQRPSVMFLVIGDGPSRRTVEQNMRQAGLEQNAKLYGWVPNREVVDFYLASDVYIMPSREEGFPRVLLEAMATGTPFVATDVGGVREICPEGQERWLVAPDDPEGFALAVIDCLNHPQERMRQAQTGRIHVRQFDLPSVENQFKHRILNTRG